MTLDHAAITDELYDRLKEHFSEPEIVELGSFIALCAGSQRWIHSLCIVPGELDLAGLRRSPAARARQESAHA